VFKKGYDVGVDSILQVVTGAHKKGARVQIFVSFMSKPCMNSNYWRKSSTIQNTQKLDKQLGFPFH